MFYIIAFLIGFGVASIGAWLYVRSIVARYESEIGGAFFRGRVSRDIELEEMLENSGS